VSGWRKQSNREFKTKLAAPFRTPITLEGSANELLPTTGKRTTKSHETGKTKSDIRAVPCGFVIRIVAPTSVAAFVERRIGPLGM
jgi:hypothetical protein